MALLQLQQKNAHIMQLCLQVCVLVQVLCLQHDMLVKIPQRSNYDNVILVYMRHYGYGTADDDDAAADHHNHST